VAGEVLEVDDVRPPLPGRRRGGDAQRVDGHVGIEPEGTDVAADQLLNGPGRHGLRLEAVAALAARRAGRGEEWGGRIIPDSGNRKGVRYEWHSVKLNTLGFKVLRRKTPAHRLIINNMISISLDPKPSVSEVYSIFYIRTFDDIC